MSSGPVMRAIRLRPMAIRWGTYLSFAAARSTARLALGLTFGLAVNTREAVARDTPAILATSSRVGFDPFCGSALTPSLYTVSVLMSTMARERSRAGAVGL